MLRIFLPAEHGYFEWTTLNGGVCNELPGGRRPDTRSLSEKNSGLS